MCLAIPMKLIERDGERGVGDVDGVRTRIMLTLTPDARIGEYVIVHTGYALSVMDETEARAAEHLLRQVDEAAR